MPVFSLAKIGLIIGVTVGIAFIVMLIYYVLLKPKQTGKKGVRGIPSDLSKAEYIGLVYNVDTNELKPIPLQQIDMTTLSPPPKYKDSLVIFKMDKAKPIRYMGKDAYFIMAHNVVGYAVPIELLLKTGIASITINGQTWDSNNPTAIADLIADLMQRGKEAKGEVVLSNEKKIGFVIKIPLIIQAITSMLGEMGISNLKAIQDRLIESKKVAERMRPRDIGPNLTRTLMFFGLAMVIIGIVYFLYKAGVFGGVTTPNIPQQAQTITQTIIQNATGG